MTILLTEAVFLLKGGGSVLARTGSHWGGVGRRVSHINHTEAFNWTSMRPVWAEHVTRLVHSTLLLNSNEPTWTTVMSGMCVPAAGDSKLHQQVATTLQLASSLLKVFIMTDTLMFQCTCPKLLFSTSGLKSDVSSCSSLLRYGECSTFQNVGRRHLEISNV